MKRDYMTTFAAEFLVLGATLLLFRVAARYWGPVSFGEYVLARRTITLIYLPCFLGLGIALPRCIAAGQALAEGSDSAAAYLLTGLLLAAAPLALLGLATFAAPGPIAALLFGKAMYRPLIPGVFLCAVGLVAHSLTYAYFRGRLQMVAANALQVLNQAAVPLLLFLIPHQTVSAFLLKVGTTCFFTASIAATSILRLRVSIAGVKANFRRSSRELLRYGLPRIPGEIALTALLTLPGIFTAHLANVEEAGHVAFGISVLGLIGGLFAPVGLVLLPVATVMVARGETQRLQRSVWQMLGVGFGITVFGVVILELIAGRLMGWYLGPEFTGGTTVLRVIALAAVPYVVFILLRSPIDALSIRALNTKNLLAGLVAFLVAGVVFRTPIGVSWALTSGLTLAAALSVWEVRNQLSANRPAEPR